MQGFRVVYPQLPGNCIHNYQSIVSTTTRVSTLKNPNPTTVLLIGNESNDIELMSWMWMSFSFIISNDIIYSIDIDIIDLFCILLLDSKEGSRV